jgi:hypothetical protein
MKSSLSNYVVLLRFAFTPEYRSLSMGYIATSIMKFSADSLRFFFLQNNPKSIRRFTHSGHLPGATLRPQPQHRRQPSSFAWRIIGCLICKLGRHRILETTDGYFVLASVYMLPCAQFARPGKGLSCDIDIEDRCMHTSWSCVPDPPFKSSNIRFQKRFFVWH